MPQLPSFPMPTGAQAPVLSPLGLDQVQGPGQQQPGPPAQEQSSRPLAGRPPVGGLNPDFAHRFVQLQNAVRQAGGDLYIFSGARDKSHQQQLHNQAIAKYGDPKIAAKHVKEPGKSAHDPEFGAAKGLGLGALAVDIRGDLHIAHKLAPQFGVEFPNQSHPWHMEMAGHSNIKA